MASVKIVYRPGGVYIRVIHNRVTRFKKVLSCKPSEFKNGRIVAGSNIHKKNKLILETANKIESNILDLEISGAFFHADEILKPKISLLSESLKNYAGYVQKENKVAAALKYELVARHIVEFKDININSVSLRYIKDLAQHLKIKGISNNTIYRYLKFIKTALKYEGKLNYDIANYNVKKTEVKQRAITIKEFKKIESKKLNGLEDLSRDVFIFQVYTYGCRVSSILRLRWSDIEKHLLTIYEKGGKEKKIIINDKIRRLLNKYENQGPYIIPLMRMEPPGKVRTPENLRRYNKQIESKTSVINKHLKVIAAKCKINYLSTHVARYSFATWLEDSQINLTLRKTFLNHSSERMSEYYSQSKPDLNRLNEIFLKLF